MNEAPRSLYNLKEKPKQNVTKEARRFISRVKQLGLGTEGSIAQACFAVCLEGHRILFWGLPVSLEAPRRPRRAIRDEGRRAGFPLTVQGRQRDVLVGPGSDVRSDRRGPGGMAQKVAAEGVLRRFGC